MSKLGQLRYTAFEAVSSMQQVEPVTPISRDITQILQLFEMISRVPRRSGKEERVRRTVRDWAEGNGFETAVDDVGNLLLRVPSSARCADAPVVVLQAHLDMVCAKRSGSVHDFDTDPILPWRDGDWLRAAETTLGADNGIGVAMALAAATPSLGVPHPQLELLFTVDEEEGLRGASGLKRSFLKGRLLINLDSESDGTVTIGCAGGAGMVLTLPAPAVTVGEESRTEKPAWRRGSQAQNRDQQLGMRLSVAGLVGGHSGTDIHRGRANANALLGRLLEAFAAVPGFQLAHLEGGSAHNAIAREARAEFALPAQDYARCRQRVLQCADAIRAEYRDTDPGLRIEFGVLKGSYHGAAPELQRVHAEQGATAEGPLQLRSHASSVQAVRLLTALPHGVYRTTDKRNATAPATAPATPAAGGSAAVETSSNLAVVSSTDAAIEIVASLRSFSADRLGELGALHRSIAAANGAQIRTEGAYGGWTSDPDSELVQQCVGVYRRLFSCDPSVEAVHAGLECGVIAQAYPEMQMVSLGPTILDAHTPDERLSLPSLERTWRFLTAILASYCSSAGNSLR